MFVLCRPHGACTLAKRLFFNREWTPSNANEAEHSFSLREKVAAGRMRVKHWMFFAKITVRLPVLQCKNIASP